jgi:hypothetical protein
MLIIKNERTKTLDPYSLSRQRRRKEGKKEKPASEHKLPMA